MKPARTTAATQASTAKRVRGRQERWAGQLNREGWLCVPPEVVAELPAETRAWLAPGA